MSNALPTHCSARRSSCAGRWRQSLNLKPAALNATRRCPALRNSRMYLYIFIYIYITGRNNDASNVKLPLWSSIKSLKTRWSKSWREKTGHLARSETATSVTLHLLVWRSGRCQGTGSPECPFKCYIWIWSLKGSLNLKNNYCGYINKEEIPYSV